MNVAKVVFLFLILGSLNACAQTPKVNVVDTLFLKAINAFIDSTENLNLNYPVACLGTISHLDVQLLEEYKPDSMHGIILIQKRIPSYELTLALHRDYSTFEWNTPAFVVEHRNRRIYITLETEVLFKFERKYKNKILKEIKSSLERRSMGSTLVALMKVKVESYKLSIGPLMLMK